MAFPGAFLGVIFLGVALRWSFLGVVTHLPSFLGVVDVDHLPSFLGVVGRAPSFLGVFGPATSIL